MKFFRRNTSLIFVILFPIIIFLFLNSTLNRHSHIIQGYVISHAHPCHKNPDNKSPFQSHQHSEDELILFDWISNFLIILASVLFVPVFLQFINKIIIIRGYNIPVLLSFSIRQYRAPPFCF
jgi:hypothetical protein